MAANIFAQEADQIVKYLKYYGYKATIAENPSRIVVEDPVWVCGTGPNNGKLVLGPPKLVTIKGWHHATRFVIERH